MPAGLSRLVAKEGLLKMAKDRVDGVGTKVAGSVKEAIGKVTGDTQLEAEGTAQKAAGSAKDIVHEIAKK